MVSNRPSGDWSWLIVLGIPWGHLGHVLGVAVLELVAIEVTEAIVCGVS